MRFRSFADHLIATIKEERLDMLNVFGLFHQRGMIAAYAAAKCGIPYMLSFRGVDLETRIFDEKSLPHVQAPLLGARSVVCVCQDSERLLLNLFRPQCPTHVVCNHFDPGMFTRKKVSIPLLESSPLPVVGCFGKFRRVTGLDFLLKAFDKLNRKRPAVLLLAGGFQKREVGYYNALIDSLDCAPNIIRVGHIEHSHILDYMQLCDVLAFPSISDASPNKILEAMYAKVPIVSTSVGGIPELVTHGQEAMLVPSRTVDPLSEAMETVLSQPALAKRLTAAAFRKVQEEFNPEQEKSKWLEVYRNSYKDTGAPLPQLRGIRAVR
jgi:glycosyltransferase involved in cell wall biosynthesis